MKICEPGFILEKLMFVAVDFLLRNLMKVSILFVMGSKNILPLSTLALDHSGFFK